MTTTRDSALFPPAERTIPLFTRYLLAGLGSLVSDFSAFAVLSQVAGIDPRLAHLISRPLGGLVCYALNRWFTFQSADRLPREFLRFSLVFLASLALTEGLLALFWRSCGLSPIVSKGLAELVAVGFNFVALRRFAFRASTPGPAGDVRARR